MKSTLFAVVPTSLIVLFGTVASGQFVPQNVSLTVFPGLGYYYGPGFGNYYGGSGQAITPYGDALRGQGLYWQGQGSYLNGTADYLRALGHYEYNHQQARRLSTENDLFELSARRKLKSQIQADKSAAQIQQRNTRLERVTLELRDQPNAARIVSGESLNYLLKRLRANAQEIEMTTIELTDDEIASVRLQTSAGLTFDEIQELPTFSGRIAWPASLSGSDFDSDRNAIEQLVQKLTDDGPKSPTQSQQIQRLFSRVQKLESTATSRIAKKGDMTAWKEARDFLKRLRSGVRSFARLNPQSVAEMLAPQFENTDELLQHMIANDLRFAPVDATNASTYIRIHAALAEADRLARGAIASH